MLIFDFDGVLIDSLDEVILTVYNTAVGQQMTSLADLPPALVGLFRRNRFHVQPIGDGILLMNWCLRHFRGESEKILEPREYEAIIATATDPVHQRSEQVYKARQQFIERDPVGWIALHHPFQPLWNELVQRQNQQGFAIVTNKNRAATERLCRHFGLSVPSNNIYSGDDGITKIEHMQHIQKRFGAETFYFLDDSLKNLLELDRVLNRYKKMLIPLLAAWGYTGPEDQKLAQKSGCGVMRQADAVALLTQLSPLR
ncbi:MAG: hypothetical protein PVH27_11600 [Desulfobacterales bacterium]|jgi:FMN phosphatase YigB (HAD superfamily)